jgi:cytochrome c oxidase cbb3-type subunit 1
VFIGTLMQRKQPHIYVANWFYLSFILVTALLHLQQHRRAGRTCSA